MAHGFLEVLEAGNSRNKTVIIQDYREKKKKTTNNPLEFFMAFSQSWGSTHVRTIFPHVKPIANGRKQSFLDAFSYH